LEPCTKASGRQRRSVASCVRPIAPGPGNSFCASLTRSHDGTERGTMPKTLFFVSWRLCVRTIGVGSCRRPGCVHRRESAVPRRMRQLAFGVWHFSLSSASSASPAVPSHYSRAGRLPRRFAPRNDSATPRGVRPAGLIYPSIHLPDARAE